MVGGGRLRVATRGSQLARWQAQLVVDRLAERWGVEAELVIVETAGDRRRDVPISELGGQGVFVKEVQAAVLDERADLAVHSAKDLPSVTAPGLRLACVPERQDPRDALVGSTLAALPTGARVGTGSVRRRSQLAWIRPDLTFARLRGNVPTRVIKSSDHDAVVVAVAALHRLDLDDRIAEILDPDVMLPQVGQGALAIECRGGDDRTASLLAQLEDAAARRAVDAERAFLAELGGGCDLPVGAYATDEAGVLNIEGLLASLDGHVVLRERMTGPSDQPEELGRTLAVRLLEEAGGAVLTDELGDRLGQAPATARTFTG
jgi:hydroxymethylbilane synthase